MSTQLSQEDLYTELGISKDTYLGYKKFTTLIPEFQDLVTNDTISASAALKANNQFIQSCTLCTTFCKIGISKRRNSSF